MHGDGKGRPEHRLALLVERGLFGRKLPARKGLCAKLRPRKPRAKLLQRSRALLYWAKLDPPSAPHLRRTCVRRESKGRRGPDGSWAPSGQSRPFSLIASDPAGRQRKGSSRGVSSRSNGLFSGIEPLSCRYRLWPAVCVHHDCRYPDFVATGRGRRSQKPKGLAHRSPPSTLKGLFTGQKTRRCGLWVNMAFGQRDPLAAAGVPAVLPQATVRDGLRPKKLRGLVPM